MSMAVHTFTAKSFEQANRAIVDFGTNYPELRILHIVIVPETIQLYANEVKTVYRVAVYHEKVI